MELVNYSLPTISIDSNVASYNIEGVADSINTTVKKKQRSSKQQIENNAILIKFIESSQNSIKYIDDLKCWPKKNQQARIITQRSFNSMTILLKIIEMHHYIEEIYITTYSISRKSIIVLEQLLLDQSIGKITLIISESMRIRTKDRITDLINLNAKHSNFKCALIWNHSKILAAKTKNEYYVVEGSGNLSDNARIEQYLIDNNEAVYNFHKNWIEPLFEKKILKRHIIL